MLVALMPDDPEVLGLLALMLLHDSRRHARFLDGQLVLLEDQDRWLWDEDEIAEGRALVEAALRRGRPGQYQLQAAIAACHSGEASDWPQIVLLYDELLALHAVAGRRAEPRRRGRDGRRAGARPCRGGRIAGLEDYRYLHSTRADLLRRLGRADEARAAYERALELTPEGAEREFLAEQAQLGIAATASISSSAPGTASAETSTSVDAGRASPKTSCRTGLIRARSPMSSRKVVTLTTSPKPQPAARSTSSMFRNTWRVCSTTSPSPTSFPSPSTGTIPERKSSPPDRTASV